MKYCLILFFAIAVSGITAHAQSLTIRGVVYDKETNQPLCYASVGLANQPNGVITNHHGHFHLYLSNTTATDTLKVSYLGYETQSWPMAKVEKVMQVGLQPASIELEKVEVHVKKLSPAQLLDSMKLYFVETHPDTPLIQHCFYHRENYSQIKRAELTLDKSTVDGFDQAFVERINSIVPEQTYRYEQFAFDLYSNGYRKLKYNPAKSIILDDSWEFDEQLEKELAKLDTTFFCDDKHFKVRSGLIPIPTGYRHDQREQKKKEKENAKADTGISAPQKEVRDIKIEEKVPLGDGERYVNGYRNKIRFVNQIKKNVRNEKDSKWDFLHEYNRYSYHVSMRTCAEQPVYLIKFRPKKGKANFEGQLVVSATDYALIQLEYNYAEGKDGTSVHVLGITFSEPEKSGIVQFEKGDGGYYLKFVHFVDAQEAGINRPLAVTEKDREGGGKNRKIKGSMDILISERSLTQLLVVSRTMATQKEIDEFDEPVKMKVDDISEYNPENWADQSIIEPSENLKKYKKQFD